METLTAPVLALVLACVVAAAVAARRSLAHTSLSTVSVTGIGAAAGLVGPLAVLVPLDLCMFGDGATTVDRWFGVGLAVGATAVAVRIAIGLFDADARRRRARSGDDVSHAVFRGHPILPWVLLSPTLIVLIVFLYLPAWRTVRLSTQLARLGAPRGIDRCVTNFTELIGPASYRPAALVLALALAALVGGSLLGRSGGAASQRWGARSTTLGVGAVLLLLGLLWTPSYQQVYIVTLLVSGGTVIGGLALALALAMLAYQPVRGGAVYRTLLVWPYAISPPIAGLIFYVMFDPNSGIIEHWLDVTLGVALPNYRQNASLAVAVVILASIWKTLGYNLLFYIAGLQTVPRDQVEAAMLDGASAWSRFRYVILPALSPITFFLIVTNLTYAFFETFGTIDYLTAGGPARATSVAMYEIFQVAIPGRDLGRGAAQSLILFAGVVALTVWQFRSTGRRVSYGR